MPVRLGSRGISKQIFLGVRNGDTKVDYVADFVRLAKRTQLPAGKAKPRPKRSE